MIIYFYENIKPSNPEWITENNKIYIDSRKMVVDGNNRLANAIDNGCIDNLEFYYINEVIEPYEYDFTEEDNARFQKVLDRGVLVENIEVEI